MLPDYLLIGHVIHDETPQGPKLGGTMSYAGSAANAMGAKVAIVTSTAKDEVVLAEMPSAITIHNSYAPQSTVFYNIYEGDVRRQIMPQRALPLTLDDVPQAWRVAPVVHLGPLDDEVDKSFAYGFPNALVAATPQGWMRAWDDQGNISPKPWEHAEELLPVLGAVIFSEEDIHRDTALEARYASLAKLLVVTRAAKGCTVYQQGADPMHVPAPTLPVVDATGAGDVFAGIFLVMLHRTNNVRRAAAIATDLASISVTRPGVSGIPTADEIRRVLDSHAV